MQTCHGISVLDRIQSKRQSKSLGKFLDLMKLFAVSSDSSVFLLQLIEFVDQSLDHGFGTIGLVIFPGLTQSVLNIIECKY